MAKHVLILGAGRSSSSLIRYLLEKGSQNQWEITVGDALLSAAEERTKNSAGKAMVFDIRQQESSEQTISQADVVVSLLPAHLHIEVAKICIKHRKHLLTASYVSDDMRKLDAPAREAGILFLNECGLDPGIDHMSAMQVIDQIKSSGGELESFESFTGGLIAPDTDPENPWRYKFTWNPRNVIMAGQGTAKFLQNGVFKFIPYQQLFKRITPVHVPGYGDYEGYANRDSLQYQEVYGLKEIKTMIRGTLRNKGYCEAWDVLVQLGCCDDSYQLPGLSHMSHRQFISSFLPGNNPPEEIMKAFNLPEQSEVMKRLEWVGLFSDEPVGLLNGTPAQALEHIFQKKWKLKPGDKDFIVMWHRFRFVRNQKKFEIQAYLTATGENEIETAMAKTVGLPLAIAAKLLLEDRIKLRGVVIPVMKELYNPILKELEQYGIRLIEKETNG